MVPVGDRFFPKPPGGFDDVYNAKTEQAVEVFQRFNDIKPTGQFGQATLDAMWAYADAYSKWVYKTWTAPKPKPIPPPLVEPNQGWASLHISLHPAYSLGRGPGYGFSDLGTYNPNSNLPSGSPSDHALYPARAFDLGIDPDTGYDHVAARAYFHSMIGRPEIGYVILGDRIWSRARASEGVRRYTGGGHANHVHVSGIR
jgi:peptidoglycan hydrolase-like protein with peptidoglycan-binding domain